MPTNNKYVESLADLLDSCSDESKDCNACQVWEECQRRWDTRVANMWILRKEQYLRHILLQNRLRGDKKMGVIFSTARDSEIITAGGFMCHACLVGKPSSEQSPNAKYCQPCYDLLSQEMPKMFCTKRKRGRPTRIKANDTPQDSK